MHSHDTAENKSRTSDSEQKTPSSEGTSGPNFRAMLARAGALLHRSHSYGDGADPPKLCELALALGRRLLEGTGPEERCDSLTTRLGRALIEGFYEPES